MLEKTYIIFGTAGIYEEEAWWVLGVCDDEAIASVTVEHLNSLVVESTHNQSKTISVPDHEVERMRAILNDPQCVIPHGVALKYYFEETTKITSASTIRDSTACD